MIICYNVLLNFYFRNILDSFIKYLYEVILFYCKFWNSFYLLGFIVLDFDRFVWWVGGN